jgi:16S rRNA (guanine527-N7)-methyltransferase
MFHVKHEGSPPPPDLDDDQLEHLYGFEQLLREWSPRLGLVADGDLDLIYERHILDSLRGAGVIGYDDHALIDQGSGAGLPGLVLAIACPWAVFTLAEAREKRAAFLELAIDTLSVTNAKVHAGRVQDLQARSADLCLARAFAPPQQAWATAERLLKAGGRLLYWAGASFEVSDLPDEIEATIVDEAGSPAQKLTLERFGPLVIMCRQ